MIKFIDILNKITEGKQLGTLYHYTDILSMIRIIESNKLIGAKRTSNEQSYYVISLTRNKNFLSQNRYLEKNLNSRIVLDGNKLSNNYKISPYASKYYRDPKLQEQEERLYMKDPYLTDLNNYVISYDIYLDTIMSNPEYSPKEKYKEYNTDDIEEIIQFLIKNKNNPEFRFYLKNTLLTQEKVLKILEDEWEYLEKYVFL